MKDNNYLEVNLVRLLQNLEGGLSYRVRIGSIESLKRTCSKERFVRESDITKAQSELSSSLQR